MTHNLLYFLDPKFRSDPFAAVDGATPPTKFSNAPLSDDVFTGPGRRVHDHEVPLQLSHLPHHC